MKIFVDCDVLLDVGLGREPFFQPSGKLLDYLEANPDNGFIAWHSVANFFYIVSKVTSKEKAKSFIVKLCQFVQVVPAGNSEVLLAASLPMNDFEDALQCAVAMAADAAVIVTRNVTDYRDSPVAAMTPEQILDELDIQDV